MNTDTAEGLARVKASLEAAQVAIEALAGLGDEAVMPTIPGGVAVLTDGQGARHDR